MGGLLTMASKHRYPKVSDLDAFSQKRFPEIATRWNDARREHQRTAFAMWVGTMAMEFADDELAILDQMGFLSEMDRILLRQAHRWPEPTSPLEPEVHLG